jgi:hypothetical protein
MRSRLLAATGALVLTLGGLLAGASPAVAADDPHCYGWDTHPDLHTSGGLRFGDGTAIRRGPYTDCDAFGRGYPGDGIDVYCNVKNRNGVVWIYVRNTTTGVTGWAAASALYPTAPDVSVDPCYK